VILSGYSPRLSGERGPGCSRPLILVLLAPEAGRYICPEQICLLDWVPRTGEPNSRDNLMIEPASNRPPDQPPQPPAGFAQRRFENRARLRRAATRAAAESFFYPLPMWIWVVSGLLAFYCCFSANPVVTPFSIMMVPAMASLLWFKGEPPILFFVSVMQWMQSAAAIFYCNEYGAPLAQAAGMPEFATATWLSLISVLVLAVGMRLAVVWRKDRAAEEANEEAKQLQPDIIFVAYLIGFVFFLFLGRLANSIPALRQPLLALVNIRWVLVFVLAYAVLQRRNHYLLLGLVVLFEMIFGFLGFFSGFKEVFFMVLIVLPATGLSLRGGRLFGAVTMGAILVGLLLIWSAIKSDYRSFLNQGTGQQVVNVSISDRIDMLRQLVGRVDAKSIGESLDQTILRVSYVNFFALCIKNVPAAIPYEHGAIWGGGIKHALIPRLFYPDKPVLDDSAETEYYTGYKVAGAEQGTSIGIGYFGESYIDFGHFGMFVPIFLLGLGYGGIYRYFVRYRHRVLGFAVATTILMFGASKVETSCAKLIGGNLVALLVLAVFLWLCGDWLQRLMSRPPRKKSRRLHRRPVPHG
jgi:hypothetical protein